MADYNINHHIYRVRQPDENSCWAACLVMKLEALGRRCYTIDGIKNAARDAGVNILPNGSVATDEANMTKLGEAFNIRITKNRGVVRLVDLVPVLKQSPVILFGGFNYEGRSTPMNHAVLMVGLWGDGSDDTGLALVDPQQTKNGTDPETDVVCSWLTLRTEIIDRLDYYSARA